MTLRALGEKCGWRGASGLADGAAANSRPSLNSDVNAIEPSPTAQSLKK
jgi:hypothetical protein